MRIARGKYFNSGKVFKIIDDLTVQFHAHRMLESSWIGTSDFRETVECIDDDDDDIDDEVKIGDIRKLKWADEEFEVEPLAELHPVPPSRVAPQHPASLNAQMSNRRDGKVGDNSDRHSASAIAHNKRLFTVALRDRGGVSDVHRLYRPAAALTDISA